MPAWSYSALTSFETCPRRHYETRVAKRVIEPESEQLRWGNAVHKALENRAKKGEPLPTGMTQWEPMMAQLDQLDGELFAETQFALNEAFVRTDWFAPDVWVRAVVDYGRLKSNKALALDYKTGKPKPNIDQLRLFSAVLMSVYPQLDEVITGYVWLKTQQIHKQTFHRRDHEAQWGGFLPRVARLQQAHQTNEWPERPSGLCRGWCPVRACQFNQLR